MIKPLYKDKVNGNVFSPSTYLFMAKMPMSNFLHETLTEAKDTEGKLWLIIRVYRSGQMGKLPFLVSEPFFAEFFGRKKGKNSEKIGKNMQKYANLMYHLETV